MKLAKFVYKRKEHWGKVEGNQIAILRHEPFARIVLTGKVVPLTDVRLLPPATASKIVLVGLNYKDHARELQMKLPLEPVIFLKPPSALIAHGEPIVYPAGTGRLDYEAELAVVIKKEARCIGPRQAYSRILGYTCLNDVTARDLQKKDIQWTRAKSFDTFCPLGPWLETNLNPARLDIKLYKNGEVAQDSNTSQCIFPVEYLVSFISRVMTLMPGDIISTGTPPGVGKMKAHDIIEVEIEKIGRLRNQVVCRRS